MSTKMRAAPRAAPDDTKSQIKAAAQMLFARHGVDAVTVQQIVAAAGQRNNAALHYHFGSKEELIRQLVVDGAAVLDERRQGMLRELEARGGPTTIREVMLVLVMPVIELGDDERWRGYIRFTSSLQASDRKTLRAALEQSLERRIRRLLRTSEADAAAAGGTDRAAALDLRDLCQRHPFRARGGAGNPADPAQPAVGPALHDGKYPRHAGGDDHLPAVAAEHSAICRRAERLKPPASQPPRFFFFFFPNAGFASVAAPACGAFPA